ncbi:MAG: hypothetical protein Q4Q03_02040 [Bowdeniella nasicola]|nr:hypothetical protein [Bowdeniella nasicola]
MSQLIVHQLDTAIHQLTLVRTLLSSHMPATWNDRGARAFDDQRLRAVDLAHHLVVRLVTLADEARTCPS